MNENARTLMKTFAKFRRLNISALMPELSSSENMTLHAIERVNEECEKKHEKAKLSILACDIDSNPAQVSRTLKSLEEKGLIERTVSKDDRRITYVTLSEAGKEYSKKTSEIINNFTNAVFAQVDQEDIQRLTKFLDSMYEVANQEIEKRKIKEKKED